VLRRSPKGKADLLVGPILDLDILVLYIGVVPLCTYLFIKAQPQSIQSSWIIIK
jgi:hypothetical protein